MYKTCIELFKMYILYTMYIYMPNKTVMMIIDGVHNNWKYIKGHYQSFLH